MERNRKQPVKICQGATYEEHISKEVEIEGQNNDSYDSGANNTGGPVQVFIHMI